MSFNLNSVRTGVVAFFLLFCLLTGWRLAPVWADGTVSYHKYSTSDGLPSKQIAALAQTTNGLLWIGTRSGLAVYDGHAFRQIPLSERIRQQQVIALQPMPDGSVWAGVGHDAVRVTHHGVVRTLLLGEHNTSEILRRGDSLLFVMDQAVWILPLDRQRPRRTPFRYETFSNVTLVRGTALSSSGQLWIVSSKEGPGRV